MNELINFMVVGSAYSFATSCCVNLGKTLSLIEGNEYFLIGGI